MNRINKLFILSAYLAVVFSGSLTAAMHTMPDAHITLSIKAFPTKYEFFCKNDNKVIQLSCDALTADLSSKNIGGFTGVYIKMYASGNGQPNSSAADFDWYEYNAD